MTEGKNKPKVNHHGGKITSERGSYQSKVTPLYPPPESQEPRKKTTVALLARTLYVFEKMMGALRTWEDTKPGRNKVATLKTESTETREEYLYRIELPKVTRDKVTLHFENNSIILMVEGVPNEENKPFFPYPHVLRLAFSLPVYTNSEAITANFRNEILTITIPKTDNPVSPKAQTIKIT